MVLHFRYISNCILKYSNSQFGFRSRILIASLESIEQTQRKWHTDNTDADVDDDDGSSSSSSNKSDDINDERRQLEQRLHDLKHENENHQRRKLITEMQYAYCGCLTSNIIFAPLTLK